MTRVVLVPNPNVEPRDRQIQVTSYVPLGLLSIATVLRQAGLDAQIVDINRRCISPDFEEAPDEILAHEPDIIGFSTMCNQYPRTLQIAASCKRKHPQATIILGGPQATVTDIATMRAFPFVDLIVRGECEDHIADLCRALGSDSALASIPGLTLRHNKGLLKTPDAPPIDDLDRLPLPDYSLLEGIDHFERLPVEIGRGCPFKCTFCSTSHFFRRQFRFKDARGQVGLMSALADKYGVRRFTLQHDNLTVSRRKVHDFCTAIKESHASITWSCSSRIDCLRKETLQEMATSGCDHIYLGIETGSPRMQKIIAKKLDMNRARRVAEWITENGMSYTASFIMGFPEETIDDLAMTVRVMKDLKLLGNGEEVTQLHMLAPEIGSVLFEKYRESLSFDGTHSDMALGYLPRNLQRTVERYPEIFANFYYFTNTQLDRNFLIKAHFLILNLLLYFPYTTLALSDVMGSAFPNELLRRVKSLDLPDSSWSLLSEYQSIQEIHRFLERQVRQQGTKTNIVREIVRYEKTAHDLNFANASENNARVMKFSFNIEEWIGNARKHKLGINIDNLAREDITILFIKREDKVQTTVLPKAIGAVFGEGVSMATQESIDSAAQPESDQGEAIGARYAETH